MSKGDKLRKKLGRMERNVLRNSVPKSTRDKISRAEQDLSKKVSMPDVKANKKTIKGALADYKSRTKSDFKKSTDFTKGVAGDLAKATKESLKSGSTISDMKAYKNSAEMDAEDMGFDDDDGGFDDFEDDDGFDDEDSDDDFDMMDDGDGDGESQIVSIDTGSEAVAQINDAVVSSVSSIISVNIEGFNIMSENIANIGLNALEKRNALVDTNNNLITILESIRKNMSSNNISEFNNSSSIEDIILGDVSMGSYLSYFNGGDDGDLESSGMVKAVNNIKDYFTKSFSKHFLGDFSNMDTIIDIPGLSSVLLGSYDAIRHGSADKAEKGLSSTLNFAQSLISKKDAEEIEKKSDKLSKNIINTTRKRLLKMPIFKGFDSTGSLNIENRLSPTSKVSFDAETHASINIAIPGYLSKLLSTISNKEEIHYSYQEGIWKRNEDIRKQYQDDYKSLRDSNNVESLLKKAVLKDEELVNNSDLYSKRESGMEGLAKYFIDNRIGNNDLDKHKDYIIEKFDEEVFNRIKNDSKYITREITRFKLNLSKLNKGFAKKDGGSIVNVFNTDNSNKVNNILKSVSSKGNVNQTISNAFSPGSFKFVPNKITDDNIKSILKTSKEIRDILSGGFSGPSGPNIKESIKEKYEQIKEKVNSKTSEDKPNYFEDAKKKVNEKIDNIKDTLSKKSEKVESESIKDISDKREKRQSWAEKNIEGLKEDSDNSTNRVMDFVKDKGGDLKDKTMDKLGDTAKDFISDKTKNIADSATFRKLKSNLAGTKIGKVATRSWARLMGAGAGAAGAAARKGSKKAAGKGAAKVAGKTVSKLGVRAIPFIGQLIGAITAAPEIFKTITNPIDSLKSPLKTLGSFLGLTEHPADAKMEEENVESLDRGLVGSVLDKVSDIKLKGKDEGSKVEKETLSKENPDPSKLSKGAKNLLAASPSLLMIPAGSLVAHQLYENVVSPTLGMGANMLHKILGMSGSFGKQMGEEENRRGGFISNLFEGLFNSLTSIAGVVFQAVAGMIHIGFNMFGGSITHTTEAAEEASSSIEDETEEFYELSNKAFDAIGSYYDEDGNKIDRPEKPIRVRRGVGDEMKETASSVEKDARSIADKALKSPLMESFEGNMAGAQDKKIIEEMDKNPTRSADRMLGISPTYAMLRERSENKVGSLMPGGSYIETTIGDWFDKIGGILRHIQGGLMGGASAGIGMNAGIPITGEDGGSENVGWLSKAGNAVKGAASNVKNFFSNRLGIGSPNGRGKQNDPYQLNLEWSNSGNRAQAGFHPNGSQLYAQRTGINGGRHYGLDLRYGSMEAIKSPSAGTLYRTNAGLGGNTVLVKTLDGWTLIFMHLDGWPKFSDGDFVNVGDTIGYAGASGFRKGGVHLHFQVQPTVDGKGIYNKNAVDPELWMSQVSGSPVPIKDFRGGSSTVSGMQGSLTPGMVNGMVTGGLGTAIRPFDFETDEWRGSITGRKTNELSKEDKDKIDERLSRRLSKKYNVPIEELRGDTDAGIIAKEVDSKMGRIVDNKSEFTPPGRNTNVPSWNNNSNTNDGKVVVTGSTSSSEAVERIINNYDNSKNSLIVNNRDKIINNHETVNNFENSKVYVENPNGFDKENIDKLKDILNHTRRISRNTKNIKDNLKSMRIAIRNMIDNMPDSNSDANVSKLIDDIMRRIGISETPVGQELKKELENEFVIDITPAIPVFEGS